jgi:hypothetical protein
MKIKTRAHLVAPGGLVSRFNALLASPRHPSER